jgi:hypothetical protein
MAKMMKYNGGKTSGVDVLSRSLCHLVILSGDLGTGTCLAYWPQKVHLSFLLTYPEVCATEMLSLSCLQGHCLHHRNMRQVLH